MELSLKAMLKYFRNHLLSLIRPQCPAVVLQRCTKSRLHHHMMHCIPKILILCCNTCQYTCVRPSQMEYCSNALSWIVDTLAQGSTFKPPRPPPTLRGTSKFQHFLFECKSLCMQEFHRMHSSLILSECLLPVIHS